MNRCQHCNERPIGRPRQLCWVCYYEPSIREKYAPVSEDPFAKIINAAQKVFQSHEHRIAKLESRGFLGRQTARELAEQIAECLLQNEAREKGDDVRGVVFDSDQPFTSLREAVLTKTKFSCSYPDIHVEATSRDGIHYVGNWGDPVLDDAYTVELTRFESKSKEVVLVGVWKNSTDNLEGVYLFRLNP